MKIENLKRKISGRVTLVFLLLSLFANTTYATGGKWIYWVTDPGHEFGITSGTTGFATKAECESSNPGYTTIASGWAKSDGCFEAKDVKITGFTPSSGKEGDVIEISGSNFIINTKILVGTTSAASLTVYDNFTKLRFTVPSGATIGKSKITVETKYHGKATSTAEFTVGEAPVNTSPWTFVNIQNQYIGAYDTEAECKTAHAEYNIHNGVVNGIDTCVQRTQKEIADSQELYPVGPIKDDPDKIYKLLAPIGNLEKIDTTGGSCPGNPDISNGISCYLNIIFKIAIGLCAALAVIMIVIAGIQYMGDESVFGKTEAKKKIFSAILGLLIALGAFAILNTLNPALTGQDGIKIDQVEAEIDDETEIAPEVATYNGSGSSKLCTTGYTDVATYGSPAKINICNSINGIPLAANLKKMIDAAKAAGIVLSGSGSRTYAQQVQLRIAHHCGDTYTASAKTCKPPTARPGHSNHEIGGAIDFTCNGKKMPTRNNPCFVWLNANASTYQFKNLPSEAWHWSFNGK
jgi:type IV secretory pathway VirB2 component (pilin)